MKSILVVGSFLALALAIPVSADTSIKIDTVPSTYTPQNYNRSERVRISSYRFEVNDEHTRTRLVVVYTYRDQVTYGGKDSGGGPKNTSAEIPGLTYDAKAQAIVYESGGAKTTCATALPKGSSTKLDIKNTGACTVTTVAATQAKDASWDKDQPPALDTYFNVK